MFTSTCMRGHNQGNGIRALNKCVVRFWGVSLCCVSRSQENGCWPWKVLDTDRGERVVVHSHVQLSRRQGQPTTGLSVSAQPSGTESGEPGPDSKCTGVPPGCPGYSRFPGLSHFNEKSLMHMKLASRGEGKSRVCVG